MEFPTFCRDCFTTIISDDSVPEPLCQKCEKKRKASKSQKTKREIPSDKEVAQQKMEVLLSLNRGVVQTSDNGALFVVSKSKTLTIDVLKRPECWTIEQKNQVIPWGQTKLTKGEREQVEQLIADYENGVLSLLDSLFDTTGGVSQAA